MKTRLSAMAAAVSTLSMLTACGGGGSGTPPFPDSAPTPTVTVTAPATAMAGFAFNVGWTSTDATSCTADFDSADTGATATYSATETAAVTKIYTVTCTGAGGSAIGTATVEIGAALAEGLWTGTTGDGRILSGVVTKEGDYWLVYTRSASDSDVVGFYSGQATVVPTTAPDGTLTSSNLRAVDFDTGITGAGLISTASYSAKASLVGNADGVPSDTITLDPVVETGDSSFSTQTGGGVGTLNTSTGILTINGTGTFKDKLSLGVNIPLTTKAILNGSVSGNTWTPEGTGTYEFSDCPTGNTYCALIPTGPIALTGASGAVSLLGNAMSNMTSQVSMVIAGSPVIITLNDALTVPSTTLPSIAPDTFSLKTYNPAYDTAPSVATVAGSYNVGSTGIGASLSNAVVLTISQDGSVSGSDAASACTYSGGPGALLVHAAGGNVYDVTITLSGGTCAYNGQTFTGVATYAADTQQVTLTALDSARDEGVMVIGTKQ